jgi:heme oxygenase (mycobilin-producing)
VTVVRINAITVPEGSGDELARRFAQRAGAVDHAEGFEGFELLRPTDGRSTWLVVTRWRDEASFRGWTTSPAFAHGHRGGAGGAAGAGGAGGASGAGAHPGPVDGGDRPPVSTQSELWSYDVVNLPPTAG